MEEIDEFFSSFNFEQYTSEGRQKAVEILSQVESKFSDVMDTNENVQKARQYIEKYDISVRQIEENNSLVFDSEEESRNLSRHKQRSGIIVGIFCCLGFFIPVVPFIVAIIYGAVSLSKYGQLKKDFDRKTLIREDGQRALRLLNRDVISENESKDLVKADNSTKDLSEASGLSCPNCKMWVSSENNFCPRCGTAITKNSD